MRKTSILFSVLISAWMVVQPVTSFAATAHDYGLPDFSELVAQTNQSVVNISTTKKVERQAVPEFRGMPEDMLRYFFGMPQFRGDPRGQQNPHSNKQPKEESHSLGSGFIISEDGYILTNNHVIDGADEIIVRMRDREELKAEVIGTDPRTDIALIKIDADNLPFAKIGKSSDLKVGQWVLAIGEPFGLDFTATHGIISALGRALPEDTYVPFIQSDVAINPGNSGGPLFNLKGEVIGINSQIYSRTGGFMGLSFAIPINVATEIADQLKKSGKVSRGRIGVIIQEITAELAESFDLSETNGALIVSIQKNGPADKAGIEIGDVVLNFDGVDVASSSDLPRMVGNTKPDTKVLMKVLRSGEIKKISIVVGEMQDDEASASSSEQDDKPIVDSSNRIGLILSELTAKQKKELDVNNGLLVDDIKPGVASGAGIRTGDVILGFNNKEMKTVRQFNLQLNKVEDGRNIALLIKRNELTTFITMKLDDDKE